MNFGELKAWVLRTMKRPELTQEATDAINAAIEYASTQGDYASEIVESSVAIDGSAYAQNIAISTTFTRFRKIKYLRPSGYRVYLTWVDPSRIFENQREKVNVWYRAGDNIVFKLSALQTSMLYAYYQYPARLTTSNGTNGYTEMMSSAIHDLACGRMWEDIGNEAEAQRLTRRGREYLLAHKMDKQDGVSHG